MNFPDLKVGMDVLVLRSGNRRDLASAKVERCAVLSADRWCKWSPAYSPRRTTVALPGGGEGSVYGQVSHYGRHALVWCDETGCADVVSTVRILGPADEWEAKIAAAREGAQRDQDVQWEEADTGALRCSELTQQLKTVGIAASVKSTGSGAVNIVADDIAIVEHIVELLATANVSVKDPATEMRDAPEPYRYSGGNA